MSSRDDAPSMALIVRGDLSLSAGKTAVQCAFLARRQHARLMERWRRAGARKICLVADDLPSLHRLANEAQEANLSYYLVQDAGHTEVPAGTITVLGIGPAPRRSLDLITGGLSTL
jgi:PTH2 family peptidyl-tRNA hydrolase